MYTLFTKDSCRYCKEAKKALDLVGEGYVEINIEEDGTAYETFKSQGFETVPQVFLGETHIGGYDELADHLLDNM